MKWGRTLGALVAGVAIGVASVQFFPRSAAVATPSPRRDAIEPPHALSDREIIDRSFLLLLPAVHASRFLGVGALQNPSDAWITQEIIHELRPDVIVDVGTHKGGSAALWATILEQVNPDGRVISIDIENQVTSASKLPIVQRRVEFLVGSSIDPAIVDEVAERVRGRTTLVILDSLHTREHVLSELKAYSPFIDVGGYIIVQDTHIDRYSAGSLADAGYSEPMIEAFEQWASDRPSLELFRRIRKDGPGAGAAVEAFLEHDDDFKVDKTRERFHLTNNWNGYLKRVRARQ